MTEKLEKLLSELVNRLKNAHGATLESVILYGSAAALCAWGLATIAHAGFVTVRLKADPHNDPVRVQP